MKMKLMKSQLTLLMMLKLTRRGKKSWKVLLIKDLRRRVMEERTQKTMEDDKRRPDTADNITIQQQGGGSTDTAGMLQLRRMEKKEPTL